MTRSSKYLNQDKITALQVFQSKRLIVKLLII